MQRVQLSSGTPESRLSRANPIGRSEPEIESAGVMEKPVASAVNLFSRDRGTRTQCVAGPSSRACCCIQGSICAACKSLPPSAVSRNPRERLLQEGGKSLPGVWRATVGDPAYQEASSPLCGACRATDTDDL